MRWKIALLAICIALFTTVVAFGFSYAQQGADDLERWDLRMIEEEHIWRYLGVNYWCPSRESWPERKAALQTVLREYPDSQWADDAAVMLALGQVSMEGDTLGGIAALREVMEKYPQEHTILGELDYIQPIGEDWTTSVAGLVIHHLDGSIVTRPFDGDGWLSEHELNTLSYFNHLEKYPRWTKDVAQLYIAYILWYQGNKKDAIAELEDLIARHPNLAEINAADREAAAGPYGYYLRHDPGMGEPIRRPEYIAYHLIVKWYRSQKEIDKAIATGLEWVSICSADGWYWRYNREVADLCAENKRWKEAEQQYQLALQGARKYFEERKCAGWKSTLENLEKRLQEVRSF